MRKLVYVLSDGNHVNTKKEAEASGLAFEVSLIEIDEPHSALTEKQRANRKAIAR